MMKDCPVCSGSRKIRLPWRSAATATYRDEPISMTIEKAYQEYPCPECAPATSEDRVAILEFGASVTIPPDNDPRREEAIRRNAAREIVERLLQDGFITFHSNRTGDDYQMQYEVRGRVGVVAASVVASMEDRIAERQGDVARHVATVAAAEIRAWGSYYTGDEGNISKAQAVDAVGKALRKVLDVRRVRTFSALNERDEMKSAVNE